MDFVITTAVNRGVPTIEFLGDLFHTHAVLRVEVIDFWRKVFDKIQEADIGCVVLVGNHDQPGSKEKEQEMNALDIFNTSTVSPHASNSRIIANKPMIINGIGYIPYMSDKEAFLKAAQDLYDQGATKCLVAHQTFTGAQYENGFFADDSIDPALVPQEQIISGHIHKTQQLGKCFYPGTPKWDTMADANQDKGIWIFTHDEDGLIASQNTQFISTKDVVTPITSYVVKEGEEIPELNPDARNYVVLEGKSAWITKVKKELKGLAQIKLKPTDTRNSATVDKNLTLDHYLEKQFKPIETVTRDDIKTYLRNL